VHNDHERITKALDALTTGLYPFVEREMKLVYKDKWHDSAHASFRKNRGQSILSSGNGDVIHWDAHTLLTVMWDQWNHVFRNRLSLTDRSLVSELREYRNRWAHQTKFDFDDTYRILDNVERLLKAAEGDDKTVRQLHQEKQDLLRKQFSREAKAAYRKSKVNQQKWFDAGVYMACGFSIILVIMQTFSESLAWFFGLVVFLVFSYLSYKRIVTQHPQFFGPHECAGCRRIIYGMDCPYCEGASSHDNLVG